MGPVRQGSVRAALAGARSWERLFLRAFKGFFGEKAYMYECRCNDDS